MKLTPEEMERVNLLVQSLEDERGTVEIILLGPGEPIHVRVSDRFELRSRHERITDCQK